MNFSGWWKRIVRTAQRLWRGFRGLKRWAQVVIVVVVIAILGGVIVWARNTGNAGVGNQNPTVTLESVDSFGNGTNGVDVIGTVQSVNEADLLAQSAGTVEAVNTTLGANVPAGFVIASLESSAESAGVLQAQGEYDAAVAASQATGLQSQNSGSSFAEQQTSARDTYESTYTSLAGILTDDVDQFFGGNTPVGPALLISPLTTGDTLSLERRNIEQLMDNWDASLSTDSATDPLTLLQNAQTWTATIASFVDDLNTLAATQGSGASTAQLEAVAAAQTSVNTLQATLTSAITAYNTAQTSAQVGATQSSDSSDQVTSAQASVEEALGALRAAQAAYQKTLITAPIAGTINFLPISVGEFVSLNQHVATVARNNALEVVMQLSQDDANRLAVGDTLTINTSDQGVVTTIAPALDPTTQQIEVELAVSNSTDLIDGESVQIALPALSGSATSTASAASSSAPTIEVPLTAVKLMPDEQDVFSVSNGHLVAHTVQIGQVIGDEIQILTPLPGNLEIVVDARGLSAGDAVDVSTSTSETASD